MRTRFAPLARLLLAPCAVAGGFLGATVGAAMPGGTGIPGLVVGWLYGLVVGAMIRRFRVHPGAYPLVGLLAGPVPLAVLMPVEATSDQRGVLLLGLVAGLLLGTVEWARTRWPGSDSAEMGAVGDEFQP